MIEKTLINFNMPNELKDRVDYLTKVKSISRTSLLNIMIEDWVRNEEKAMLDDKINSEKVRRVNA